MPQGVARRMAGVVTLAAIVPHGGLPLRVRALLDWWFGVLLLFLLVLALVMGVWAYQMHFVPHVEEETAEEVIWSERTPFENSSVIVNDTLPFEEGDRVTN